MSELNSVNVSDGVPVWAPETFSKSFGECLVGSPQIHSDRVPVSKMGVSADFVIACGGAQLFSRSGPDYVLVREYMPDLDSHAIEASRLVSKMFSCQSEHFYTDQNTVHFVLRGLNGELRNNVVKCLGDCFPNGVSVSLVSVPDLPEAFKVTVTRCLYAFAEQYIRQKTQDGSVPTVHIYEGER